MADLNNLLLMQLAQSYADQGSGKNPFGPTLGGAAPGRDPFSVTQAMGQGAQGAQGASPMFPPTAGANPEMMDDELAHPAEAYGVTPEEADKPVTGELAKQFGVEGVTPDYKGLGTVMNMLKISAQKGYEAGQQAGPDPVLRSALSYQALQNQAQALGGQSPGGMLINAMGPLMAPMMLGPLAERQRMEEQQAKQQALAFKLAETQQLGEKRRADMALSEARRKKIDAETLLVGNTKYELKGNPTDGMAIFNPDTGEYQIVEPGKKNTGKQIVVKGAVDPKTGYTKTLFFDTAEDLAAHKPAAEYTTGLPGTDKGRADVTKAFGLYKKLVNKITTTYKKGMTGPYIGAALEARKEGNVITKPLGALYSRGKLSAADLAKALELRSDLAIINQQLVILASGLSYTDEQDKRIRQSMGEITDYDEDFKAALGSTTEYMKEMVDLGKQRLGIDIETGTMLDPKDMPKPPEASYVGDPTTPVKSEMRQRQDDEILKGAGLK